MTIEDYPVEIIKKNNKNIYIRVKEGKVIITCNYLTTNRAINRLINDNYDAILRMITKDKKKQEKEEKFYLFGKVYDVVYGFTKTEITNDKIYILNNKELTKLVDQKVKQIFNDKLEYWYKIFEENIPKPNLKIRKMTSRWGVCNTKNKNVTLNYYLYKYDIECLDYVIIHELSHFIHPNHSKNFWSLVNKYCKDYKKIRNKLKE